jgi:hypothetical protein
MTRRRTHLYRVQIKDITASNSLSLKKVKTAAVFAAVFY